MLLEARREYQKATDDFLKIASFLISPPHDTGEVRLLWLKSEVNRPLKRGSSVNAADDVIKDKSGIPVQSSENY